MTNTTLLPPKSAQDKDFIEKCSNSISNKEKFGIFINVDGSNYPLPMEIQKVFIEVIENMAKGKAISLIPLNVEMTTQQAADFLNVSRPFLIQLLNDNKIKFRKVGSHRRVIFEDLLRYKEESYKNSMKLLDELVKEGQELGLY